MLITEADIYTVTCPKDKMMWKIATEDMLDSIKIMYPFAHKSLDLVQHIYDSTANYFYYDSACNCYWFYCEADEAHTLRLKSLISKGQPDYIVMPYFKVFERWFKEYNNVILLTPF